MPPKKICSDKAPLNKREWSVSSCYKRGVKSGFVAGIKKEKEKQKQKRKIVEATAQSVVMSKFKTVPVASATNDLRKTYLKELKVPNYRNLSAEQTIEMLKARGFDRLIVPRIK